LDKLRPVEREKKQNKKRRRGKKIRLTCQTSVDLKGCEKEGKSKGF